MSASLSWMAWCSPMGLPKVVRCRAYAREASKTARARPTARAAMLMRPTSSTPRIWGSPRPGWPTRLAAGDPVVGVGHLDRLDAPVAELAHVPARGDAPEARPGLLLDDEGGDALLGARGQGHDGGPLAVGDPRLGPVEGRTRRRRGGRADDVAGVAAGVGLGEGQGAAACARGHAGQPTRCWSSVAVGHDQVAAIVWVLTAPVRLIQP